MKFSSEDHDYALELLKSLGAQPGRLQVSVSPVSRQPYKVWPTVHFAKLIDWLIESYGAQVYFLHGPGEEHFIDSVTMEMKNDPMPPVGIPNLLQTRALLAQMDFHFGNDNGLRHLAIAAGIPSLGVFGKPSAVSWTPPEQTIHRSVEYDPGCKNNWFLINKVNKSNFYGFAYPGDQVELVMETMAEPNSSVKTYKGTGTVGGKKIIKSEFEGKIIPLSEIENTDEQKRFFQVLTRKLNLKI